MPRRRSIQSGEGGVMATLNLSLHLDASEFDAAMPDLKLLLERVQEIVPGIVDLGQVVAKLFVVEPDGAATSAAGHLGFALKPTYRFGVLVAAARAGNLNFGVVE